MLGDNTASIAIAARDGVCRLKHVSGRLLWIQQRQQREESEHCRVDTIANVADMGTKVLTGRRVRMSLHLCSFQNDRGDFGVAEFEEKQKKLAREKIKAMRKIVHAEVLETPTTENSTLVNTAEWRRSLEPSASEQRSMLGGYGAFSIKYAMDHNHVGHPGFHLGGDNHHPSEDHAHHACED